MDRTWNVHNGWKADISSQIDGDLRLQPARAAVKLGLILLSSVGRLGCRAVSVDAGRPNVDLGFISPSRICYGVQLLALDHPR